MPVSPTFVQQNSHPGNFVNDVISKIDTKLSDSNYVKNWVCNSVNNPTYNFAFLGSFTEQEKKLITDAYISAGWGTVKVINSEENGERSGACGVTLKTYKE